MNDILCAAYPAPLPLPSPADPWAQEAYDLLSLNTPEDTARAAATLSGVANGYARAEWCCLMGICALRKGHVADAQAYLDRACSLTPPEDVETSDRYRAAYASVRAFLGRKKKGAKDAPGTPGEIPLGDIPPGDPGMPDAGGDPAGEKQGFCHGLDFCDCCDCCAQPECCDGCGGRCCSQDCCDGECCGVHCCDGGCDCGDCCDCN